MIQYSRSVRFNDLPCPGLIARVQTYMRAVPSPDPHQTALTYIQPHEDTKLHTQDIGTNEKGSMDGG